jgi:metal-responsive CopG/Arc/MetJ family transcriptional regulator
MNVKTSVYLPAEMKRALESEARRRGMSEAEMIREAISALLAAAPARRQPRFGVLDSGDPHFAERAEDHLAGLGAESVSW